MGKQDNSSNKIIQMIGFFFFGFLFFVSWKYYKERMLSFDPAYFAYQLTQFRIFFIAIGRWGSVFSQILPLAALATHCSLPIFLKLYSVAFIINYYLIFLFITLILKNNRAGLVLLLALCLGFRLVFYYATAELYFGIALSVLLWAIIAPENPYTTSMKRWMATLLSLPLIVTISYCHQLTVFTILFALFFEMIYCKRYKDFHLWLPIFFTMIWFFIRIKYLTTSEYEQEKNLSLDKILESIPNFLHLPGWYYFKTYFLHSLSTLCYTFLFCFLIALFLKRGLLFIYIVLFPLVFLVLIILIYAGGSNNLFYENYYTVFGFFAGVSLLYLIYERFPKALLYLLIVTLAFYNLRGIYNAHTIQTERVHYLDRLTNYGKGLPQKKYLLNLKNIPLNIAALQGFISFETLLNSSLQSPDSAMSFYWTDDMKKYDSLLNKKDVFLGPDFCVTWFTSNNMNRRYFRLPSTGYVKVNSSQADSSFHEEYFNAKNVHLQAMQEVIHSNNYEFVIAPIRIQNTSSKTIFSTPDCPHPVYMTYHVYNIDNKLLYWGNVNTTLEVDVRDDYTQGLLVYLPPKKGTYIIEADMQTEGLRYWNTTTRFNLVYE